MTIAVVHVHPGVSVPLAVVLLAVLVWYWRQLAAAGVPETRRRLRRASIVVMVVALFVFVGALSFIDGTTQPSQYTVTWAMAISLLLVVLFIAFLDMLNSARLHRREAARISVEAKDSLRKAMEEAMADRRGDPDPARDE